MTKAKKPKPSRQKRAGPAIRTNPATGAFQISDEIWKVLHPLIPEHVNTHRVGGRPRVSDRTCANGIFYVLRTGCQWKALDATGVCSGSTAHLRTLQRRVQQWRGIMADKPVYAASKSPPPELSGLPEMALSTGDPKC